MMTFSGFARSSYAAVGLVLLSQISMTSGASLAKSLFSLLPPAGVTSLRLAFSALVLLCFLHPWKGTQPKISWKNALIYGVAVGCMNLSFYYAIERIPLGVAVGIEIMGPLSVALASSRRLLDVAWVVSAVTGLSLLLPLQNFSMSIDPIGVALAVLAGVLWAAYVVFSKRNSSSGGAHFVMYGMIAGTLLIMPVGIWESGSLLLEPHILFYGACLGIASSALPYSLEIIALKRLPARVFGTLLSLSPGLAALSAFIFLGELLSLAQWIGLGFIIVASIGTSVADKKE